MAANYGWPLYLFIGEDVRYISLVIESMRPRQWIKNLFVFAGILFTLDLHHPITDFLLVTAAFILFCLISGCIYIINDIRDIDYDAIHSIRSHRPIASGRLPIEIAKIYAGIICALTIGISMLFWPKFGLVLFVYGILMIAYSLGLKNAVIIDVLIISIGFVLRAVGGAVIIDLVISPWLLICTTFIALFLGFGKRREELSELGGNASDYRMSFADYTIPSLDQLMNITAACTIMSYALYTFLSDTGARHPYMYITLIFVIYGILRYLMLTAKGVGAKSPELLLLNDKPLLVNVILWAFACGVIVYFG